MTLYDAVACWWAGEAVIRLSCVPRHVPARVDGRAVNVRAVYRWTTDGVSGVRLRRFRTAGGQWCTTREELARWQAALTVAG